jgi:hypothetical protein
VAPVPVPALTTLTGLPFATQWRYMNNLGHHHPLGLGPINSGLFVISVTAKKKLLPENEFIEDS